MRSVSVNERRFRLAHRHGLVEPPKDPVEVARTMVGLHSSDPSTVFLSIHARIPEITVADIETALYEDRSIVRILGMRRTMWVTPTEFAPILDSSSTRTLVGPQQKRQAFMIESPGISDDGATWAKRIGEETLAALRQRGEATARELTEDVPELGETITMRKKDGSVMAAVGVSTRVLFLLATEGRIVRARPLGSWISSQYRWTTIESWLGSPLSQLDEDEARERLLEEWLMAFGPGTVTDMKWWTGWTVTAVRETLERIAAVEVDVNDETGYLHRDDEATVSPPEPWVGLLPSLDPTTMGWKKRDWYLGDHSAQLFDRNGNARPTVWVDGRIVGGWAQRKTGEIAYEIFEEIGGTAEAAIEARAAALETWIGDVRVTPRFRSPHDKKLSNRGETTDNSRRLIISFVSQPEK